MMTERKKEMLIQGISVPMTQRIYRLPKMHTAHASSMIIFPCVMRFADATL